MRVSRRQILTCLAGILAARHAPAAFVRSAIAARNLAFTPTGGGGGPTARDYVGDFLAHWNAVENLGYGSHGAGADGWKDLSGNGYDLTRAGAAYFTDNALVCGGSVDNYMYTDSWITNVQFVEIAYSDETSYLSGLLDVLGSDIVVCRYRTFLITSHERRPQCPWYSGFHTVGIDVVNGIYFYDGESVDATTTEFWSDNDFKTTVGRIRSASNACHANIHAVRLHSTVPSAYVLKTNRAIDVKMFT